MQLLLSHITNKVSITFYVRHAYAGIPVKLCVAAVIDIFLSLSDAFE